MSTLWTFGCSYTAEYHPVGAPNVYSNYDKYKVYKGGILPETWPTLLAKKLNLNVKNKGVGGSSNYFIFNKFIENIDYFKEGDIIIIGWTSLLRFMWANNESLFTLLPSYYFESMNFKLISKETFGEILINRENLHWTSEIWYWIKFINKFCELKNIKIFYWTSDENLFTIYGNFKYITNFIKIKNDYKFVWKFINSKDNYKHPNYPQISMETNNEIDDGHLGEYGHKFQSEVFYNFIIKNL